MVFHAAFHDGHRAVRSLRHGIDAQRIALHVRIVGQHVEYDRFVLVYLRGIRRGLRRVVHRQDAHRNVRTRARAVFIDHGVTERHVSAEVAVRGDPHLAAAQVFHRCIDHVVNRRNQRRAVLDVRIVFGQIERYARYGRLALPRNRDGLVDFRIVVHRFRHVVDRNDRQRERRFRGEFPVAGDNRNRSLPGGVILRDQRDLHRLAAQTCYSDVLVSNQVRVAGRNGVPLCAGHIVVHVVHRERNGLGNVFVGDLIVPEVQDFRLVVDRGDVDDRRLARAERRVRLVRERKYERILSVKIGVRRICDHAVSIDGNAPVRRLVPVKNLQQRFVAVQLAVRIHHTEIDGNVLIGGRRSSGKARCVVLSMDGEPHRMRRLGNAVADADDQIRRAVDVRTGHDLHVRTILRPCHNGIQPERHRRTVYNVGRVYVEIQVVDITVDVVERYAERRAFVRILATRRRIRRAVDHRRVVHAVHTQADGARARFAAVRLAHRIRNTRGAVCVFIGFKADGVFVHYAQRAKIGRRTERKFIFDAVRIMDGQIKFKRRAVFKAIDGTAVGVQRIGKIHADINRRIVRKVIVLRARAVGNAVCKRVQSVWQD